MEGSGRWLGAAAAIFLPLFAPSCRPGEEPQRQALRSLPQPTLVEYESVDQARMRRAQRDLDEVLEQEKPGNVVADAAGELGGLYLAVDLFELAETALVAASDLDPSNTRWPYLAGVIAQRAGRWPEALSWFQRVEELEPDDPIVHLRLGEILLNEQRLDSAQSHFEVPLGDGSQRDAGIQAAAHFGLGRIAVRRGDLEEAIRQFERTLVLQPGATTVHYPTALAYRELGDLDAARRHIDQAGDRIVSYDDPVLDRVAGAVGGPLATLQRGNLALEEGRAEEAVRLFREAIATDPTLAAAHHALGTLLATRSDLDGAADLEGAADLDGAEQSLRSAISLDPTMLPARFNLATLLARNGRFDAALEEVQDCLLIDPGSRPVRRLEADIRAAKGDHEEALDRLIHLLDEQPDDIEVLQHLVSVALRSETWRALDRRLAEALGTQYDARLAARTHHELGRLQLGQNDLPGALQSLGRAVDLDPQAAEPRLTYGSALASAGRDVEALDAIDIALRLDPASTRGHIGKARILMRQGRDAEAASSLRLGLASIPHASDLTVLLTSLLLTSNDPAVRDPQTALDLATAAFRRQPRPELAATVAKGLAQLGRYEDAIEWQQDLLNQSRKAGVHPSLEAVLLRDLDSFKSRLDEAGVPTDGN